MQLVERHLVKKDHPLFGRSSMPPHLPQKICITSPNYQIRQAFIHEGKYLPYAEVFHRIKHLQLLL